MAWVHWWNNTRLHEALNYQTPTERETTYYKTNARENAQHKTRNKTRTASRFTTKICPAYAG